MKDYSLVDVCKHLFMCRCQQDTFLSIIRKDEMPAEESDSKGPEQPPVAEFV
jgi:hypothetical protein